jgi:hypothetical protein
MRPHFLVPLVVLLLPASVFAQSGTGDGAARAYFESGRHAFEARQWSDCAHDFERSFEIMFAPELLYNIGLCYQHASSAASDAEATRLLERALTAYRRFVSELPDHPNAVRARQEILDLQARFSHIASEPETTSDVSPETAVDPATEGQLPEAATEQVPRGQYPVTITAGVLSLASAIVAIGLGVHAQDLYNGYLATCGGTPMGCASGAINDVNNYSIASNVMYGVAGAFFAVAGIGFAFEFTSTESRVTRASLTVSGRF